MVVVGDGRRIVVEHRDAVEASMGNFLSRKATNICTLPYLDVSRDIVIGCVSGAFSKWMHQEIQGRQKRQGND